MKRLIFTVILVLGLWAAPLARHAVAQEAVQRLYAEYEDLFNRCHPAIVAITQKTNPRQVHPSLGNGVGSGVVISADGLVLTTLDNLSRGNADIKVIHSNHKLYEADVINRDPYNGVALLRLKNAGKELPFLTLGDSDTLRPGSVVMTLSNAFGSLTQNAGVTYSVGVVSGRYLPEGEGLYHGEVIETDAAVNPGAFGGALVNTHGEMVGLLSDAFSYNRWLGTAIPASQLSTIIDALKSPELAMLPGACPIRVVEKGEVFCVAPAGSAATLPKGLNAGDTILRFNGRAVKDAEALAQRLSTMPAGASAWMDVQGADGTVRPVQISWSAAAPLQLPKRPEHVVTPEPGSLGCVVRSRFDENGGAEIRSLEPLGAASKAGLKEGDVIRSLAGVPVLSASALKTILESLPVGADVDVDYLRDGKTATAEARLRGKIT